MMMKLVYRGETTNGNDCGLRNNNNHWGQAWFDSRKTYIYWGCTKNLCDTCFRPPCIKIFASSEWHHIQLPLDQIIPRQVNLLFKSLNTRHWLKPTYIKQHAHLIFITMTDSSHIQLDFFFALETVIHSCLSVVSLCILKFLIYSIVRSMVLKHWHLAMTENISYL